MCGLIIFFRCLWLFNYWNWHTGLAGVWSNSILLIRWGTLYITDRVGYHFIHLNASWDGRLLLSNQVWIQKLFVRLDWLTILLFLWFSYTHSVLALLCNAQIWCLIVSKFARLWKILTSDTSVCCLTLGNSIRGKNLFRVRLFRVWVAATNKSWCTVPDVVHCICYVELLNIEINLYF